MARVSHKKIGDSLEIYADSSKVADCYMDKDKIHTKFPISVDFINPSLVSEVHLYVNNLCHEKYDK